MRVPLFMTLVSVIVLALPADAQQAWWLDPDVQRRLSLTAGQVMAIERLNRSTLPERKALRAALDRADRALSAALADQEVSDETVAALVDRAEAARQRRNVARSMLLIRIYRILTPGQRETLPAVHATGRRF